MYEEPMILNTICTLLIKGNKTAKKYFSWYQKAVDSDLKIAQLYEYYMMTIDEDSAHGPLPKSLVLYFMHGNALDYKKAAYLYASLVTHEEQAVAEWVRKNNKHAGATTNTLPSSKCLYMAVRGSKQVLAVAGVAIDPSHAPDAFEKNLMVAILDECGLALEKEQMVRAKQQVEETPSDQ